MAKKCNFLYVDAFLIEATGLKCLGLNIPNNPTESSTSTIFGRLSFRDKAKYSTRYQEPCFAPIWNEDCTFTLPEETIEQDELGLEFNLMVRTPGLISSSYNSIGKTFISFVNQSHNEMIDLTLSLSPTSPPRPPSSSSSLSKFSSQPIVSVKEEEGGEWAGGEGAEGGGKGGATVHLVFYLTNNPEEGILSSYGKPMKSIPFRLAPGDLLLLSNTQWSSVGVQFVTWSQWDHVAMVTCLKGRPNALRFFEVTQEGVEFYALDDTLNFYLDHNSVIGIRRLKVNRTPAMIDALSDFAEETRGRPYKKDYFQLVRSIFQSNQEDDTSSLFCSQLIVAAYQSMGVVKNETLSNNFLPGHFTEHITEHMSLGELDQLVTFSSK